jgi:hypothetical protein
MTNATLKKEIHKVIDNIDDNQVLEAVFTLLNARRPQSDYELSENDIKIIEERRSNYKKGKTKTYTVSEVKKKILKNLGK